MGKKIYPWQYEGLGSNIWPGGCDSILELTREFERWLGINLSAPREDQRGYGGIPTTEPRVPSSWREGARLVMRSVPVRDENGKNEVY